MVNRIIRLTCHVPTKAFRLINIIVAFLLVLFVHGNGLDKYSATVPYAQITIKGTVRFGNLPVSREKITLLDTATKKIVDSALSDASGSFLMTFSAGPPWPNTWILITSDGGHPGCCFTLDTLISIPIDSLKGSSSELVRSDTVTIDPQAGCGCLSSKNPISDSYQVRLPMHGLIAGSKWYDLSGRCVDKPAGRGYGVYFMTYGRQGALVKKIKACW